MGRLGLLLRFTSQQQCLKHVGACNTNIVNRTYFPTVAINKCSRTSCSVSFAPLNLPVPHPACAGTHLLMRDSTVHMQCRTMAGHSHWQNIRHTKAAADAKKQSVIEKYQRQMKGVINESGADPEKNTKLRVILDKMRAANIPKADIKRYLDNATKKAGSTQLLFVEVRGPQGSVFVVQLDSEHTKKSKDLVSSLMKKTIGKVQPALSFHNLFDMKGVIAVPVTKEMDVSNMDPYLEIAIEAGAEDVILTKDEDGEEEDLVLKFHTDPKTVSQVAKEIEESHGLEVSMSQVELFPHSYVTIESKEDIEACQKIAEKLQTHEEFVNLFDNVSIPDE